jgi:hypothetical protein
MIMSHLYHLYLFGEKTPSKSSPPTRASLSAGARMALAFIASFGPCPALILKGWYNRYNSELSPSKHGQDVQDALVKIGVHKYKEYL